MSTGVPHSHVKMVSANKTTTLSHVCVLRAGTGWCAMWKWSHAMMLLSGRAFLLTDFATMELAKIMERSIDAYAARVLLEVTVRLRLICASQCHV